MNENNKTGKKHSFTVYITMITVFKDAEVKLKITAQFLQQLA